MSFSTDAMMPSIRHAKWPNQKFFIRCLYNSPDGRWFALGGPAGSRQEWQSLVKKGPVPTELVQVRAEQAAAVFPPGFELPPDLAATVQAIASEGNPPATPASVPLKTLIELANKIRRDHPRQRNVPKFLELIAHEDPVDFDMIRDKVHEAEVEDNTVDKTIIKARQAIVEARIPITISVSARRVYKKHLSG
jgi:hypothetical protein